MRTERGVRPITDPRAFVQELEVRVGAMSDPEAKYQFQIGLKDVEFDVDQEKAKRVGLSFPMSSIDDAERTLSAGAIALTRFAERGDGTLHEVIEFDPTPVRYSGFANCVTHCLAWTEQGIFELVPHHTDFDELGSDCERIDLPHMGMTDLTSLYMV